MSRYQGSASRIGIIGATIGIVVLSAAISLANAFVWWGTCGGDGGSPYSAIASPLGQTCDRFYDPDGGRIWQVLVACVIGPAVAGIVASMLRRWKALGIAVMIAAIVQIGVFLPTVVLEDHCTAEQRASLPARQCETYN